MAVLVVSADLTVGTSVERRGLSVLSQALCK
jgi:hypothetical protein